MIVSDQLLGIASTAQITLWSVSYIQEWIATPDEPVVKILVKSELIYRDSTSARS